MANSTVGTVALATRIGVVAERVTDLLAEVNDILEFNSDKSIDWAAGQTPAYIPEDAAGNIDGLTFSRTQVANAIGSLDQFRRLLTNLSVTQGDHLGNLNLVGEA